VTARLEAMLDEAFRRICVVERWGWGHDGGNPVADVLGRGQSASASSLDSREQSDSAASLVKAILAEMIREAGSAGATPSSPSVGLNADEAKESNTTPPREAMTGTESAKTAGNAPGMNPLGWLVITETHLLRFRHDPATGEFVKVHSRPLGAAAPAQPWRGA
jgi:hypothetical protein